MKWLIILAILVAAFFVIRFFFFAKKVVYSFENNGGKFVFTSTDTATSDSIGIWTMEMNTFKNEPLSINFIHSEAAPNAEKLESIKVYVYSGDDKTPLPATTEIQLEYFNGKILVNSTKKDIKEKLNTLIDWKDVNYTYEFLNKEYLKKDNRVTYTVSTDCTMKNYPDTLRLEVVMTWSNGERKYESIMTKGDYVGRKFNPKF